MLKRILISLTLLSIFSLLYAENRAGNQTADTEIAPGKFIVKFRRENALGKINQPALADVVNYYNITKHTQIFSRAKNEIIKQRLNLDNVFLLETSTAADIKSIVNKISKDPRVEYAEPVYRCNAEFTPNDTYYSSMFQFPQVSAPAAWDIHFGSEDVIVGIIDSGVDWDHEDLADLIWNNENEIPGNGIDDDGNGYIDDIRGWDFITEPRNIDPQPGEDSDTPDNDPMDFHGHGSHVAGIAAAVSNNGTGVASLSGGATIMPLRIGMRTTSGNGSGYSDWMAEAYIYAADNGAHVTNLSFGNSGQVIIDAAYYAFQNGVLIVESAGNGDAVTPSALGAQDWVISVGSVNQDDAKTYYSSYGDYVKVSAPGGELFVNNDTWGILSTVPYPSDFYAGPYEKFQGTSMAAPFVASLGALIKSHFPGIDVIDLYTRIVETADNIDAINPNYVGLLGTGRVNAYRALTENVEAQPKFEIAKLRINDASGNNNGLLDPGEQVDIVITLRNVWRDAQTVNVDLSSSIEWPINIDNPSVSLGNVTGVLDTSNWEKEAAFTITCDDGAIPGNIGMQLSISAAGYNQTIEFNLPISPQVLFIADFDGLDGGYFDFSDEFINALEANNISYDHIYFQRMDKSADGFEHYKNYKIIVWGCEWSFPSLDSLSRQFIREYLTGGGSLFLSGQDIGWELYESQNNTDVSFYENFLRARYKADDAGVNTIQGVDGDPITDGLKIDFFQPKRANDQQFPDIVDGLNGGEVILKYENGFGGATKYSGNYRVVNFGFGGFEAVTDNDIRNVLMRKIINWLTGIDYQIDVLKDTENTTDDYAINFFADSEIRNINSVELYYDTDGELPFNKVVMTDEGNGEFAALIPSQAGNTDVSYFVWAKADDGAYLLTETHGFHVGPDNIPPYLAMQSNPLRNSINLYGPSPYNLIVSLSDNIGIDPASAEVVYWLNDQLSQSNPLVQITEDSYSGSFGFNQKLEVGNKVSYFFSARDISSNQNLSTSDTFYYFIDTLQVIDDFELTLNDWELEGDWGLSDRNNTGLFSLTDSPSGFYANGINISALYKMPLNLEPYKYAAIEFYLRANIERNKDTLFLELSEDDGITWNEIFNYSQSSVTFKLNTIDISDFTGSGFDYVTLRFRLLTDSEGERDGVWIDDISIKVSEDSIETSVSSIPGLPNNYSLEQNFPNPFNPATTINYSLPKTSKVVIEIYNVIGQKVDTVIDQVQETGNYRIEWNGVKLASGVYIYKINAHAVDNSKSFSSVRKMILMK